jgi:hypothetical protein
MNAVRSYRVVGRILGISPQVVQRVEFEALKKCRERLRKDCPDDFADAGGMAQTNEHERKSGDDAGV